MDFISTSPSLNDILKIVDHKDILNCKLVNRRLLQVIRNNAINMPREKASLQLVQFEEDSMKSYFSIYTYDTEQEHDIFVFDGLTVLVACPRSILQYFKENGTLYSTRRNSKEELDPKEILNDHYLSAEEIENCLVYRNSGLLDGLRTTLSILFRRHYFDDINLENDGMIEECETVFADVFRSCRSRCNSISAPILERLNYISSALACNTINVYTGCRGDFYMGDIAEVVRWDRDVKLTLHIGNLEDFSVLLQKWESGLFSLKKVELISCTDRDTSQRENLWYDVALADIISPLQQMISEENLDSGDINSETILRLERRSDGKILLLTSYYKDTPPFTRHLSINEL